MRVRGTAATTKGSDSRQQEIDDLKDVLGAIRRALGKLGYAFSLTEFETLCKHPENFMRALVFVRERGLMHTQNGCSRTTMSLTSV